MSSGSRGLVKRVGQPGTGEDAAVGGRMCARRLMSNSVDCTSCNPRKLGTMYIGLGTLVVVLVVVAIIYFVRRA